MSASLPPFLVILFASTVILLLLRPKKRQTPYPPGPLPKPIVGNAFDIPVKKPWVKYLDLSKKYDSDIIHFSVMNTHIIVLNRKKDITELLEKRSTIYSDRPSFPIIKLIGADDLTALIQYGNNWRKQRKLFRECLGQKVIPSYEHFQTEKVQLMLELLLNDPKEFMEHCKWLSTAVTLATTFGYDVIPGQNNDRFVKIAEEAAGRMAKLIVPGGTLVNILPFLKHIPPWVPGASAQKEAAEIRKGMSAYKNEPFEYVVQNLVSGNSKECMLENLLQRRPNVGGAYEDEGPIKSMVVATYIAGVETSHIAQLIFFLTMALHPNEQKRAQEEIDRVVGTERLPTFRDRASLPYVGALVRETLRWRLALPLSVPRSTVSDDVHSGFYIPKGSIVVVNTWALTRDESVYPDPESFRPERFLNSDGTLNDDTMEYVFGFGRRICPGRFVADAVLWLVVATVLSTFNISKAKDENGVEIEIDPDAFTDSVTSSPLPFKCSIVPRSRQAEGLIRSLVGERTSNT
ncbi:hypothetical protein AX15_001055 [Amanita polypyramis BW_CC]|nr:hypothetical protein AX15_001055 [Amanita polypyramis BW_CC]